MCEAKERPVGFAHSQLEQEEEIFSWSASTQFNESPIGLLWNKYKTEGVVSLTMEERETLHGWYINNNWRAPKNLT